MMIFKQAAATSIILILGAPNAAFGRLRGGIKGDDHPSGESHDNYSRELSTSGNVIKSGIVPGVTDTNQVVSYGDGYSASNPIVFANMMTFKGIDTSETRVHQVTASDFEVFVQEERSANFETRHYGKEDVGYMMFDYEDTGPDYGPYYAASLKDKNDRFIGEVGKYSVSKSDLGGVIMMDSGFVGSQYVAIIMPNSYDENGEDPVHIRVGIVIFSGNKLVVSFSIEEWSYQDNVHGKLDLAYMIVEEGVHTLPNGKIIEAKLDTSVNENFKQIDFSGDYDSTPVVLSQSQTMQETDQVVTRMKGATNSGIMVRLQEEELSDGKHADETVGLIIYGN